MNVIKCTATDNNTHNSRVFYQLSQHLLLREMKQWNFSQIWSFNNCYQQSKNQKCSV